MIITDIRLIKLEAKLFQEDYEKCYKFGADSRRSLPIDVVEGFQVQKDNMSIAPYEDEQGRHYLAHVFLIIETDENIEGFSGPISNPVVSRFILNYKKDLLGADPLETGKIWQILFSLNINNFAGEGMEAISYIDLALWDIKCKKLKLSLPKLLGGAMRKKIPVYANMAGVSYDLEQVSKTVKHYTEDLGYAAMKWYAQFGPADGKKGVEGNKRLFKTIREAAGPDVSIMIDAWGTWGKDYSVKMAKILDEYNIEWIEEPVYPLQLDACKQIREKSNIKIATGENIRNKWHFKQLIEKQIADIYMPDPAWCGGITEMIKILALMESCDVTVVIHNSIPSLGAAISAVYPVTFIPIAEYLVTVGWMTQYFFKTKTEPQKGYFELSELPGIGVNLDFSKAEKISDIN